MAMRYLVTRDLSDLLVAAAFAPAAFIFDVLDGRIARWRQTSSALGRELDSLADVISFGVAPAALAFACGMDGAWDAVVLFYFVFCGVSLPPLQRHRQALPKQHKFPTSRARRSDHVVLTAVLAWAAWQGRSRPAARRRLGLPGLEAHPGSAVRPFGDPMIARRCACRSCPRDARAAPSAGCARLSCSFQAPFLAGP